jgi:transcriptional regulator with XRE-family HTH domain
VSEGAVSSWLKGRFRPGLSTITEIAKVLNLTIVDLLADDDSLARNDLELTLLRRLRNIPEKDRDQAAALIAAVLDTLIATPHDPE